MFAIRWLTRVPWVRIFFTAGLLRGKLRKRFLHRLWVAIQSPHDLAHGCGTAEHGGCATVYEVVHRAARSRSSLVGGIDCVGALHPRYSERPSF